MPILSIIVPIYNTEKYLDACINSILKQSYTDFELLLIDDGSSDLSGEICDSFEKIDPRVSVFHTENRGVSCARNLGLDHAKGKFVMFVDSDDEIPENAVMNLISDSVDFSVGSVLRIECGQQQEYRYDISKYYQINKELFFDDSFPTSVLLDGPCAKLYKTDIISNNALKFNEKLNYGEDKVFVYSYLLYAKTIKTTSDIVYIQKRRAGSLSSNISDKRHLKQIIDFLSCYVPIVKKYQEKFTCQSVREMYHVDVIQRYVYRYLRIVRQTKEKSLNRKDLAFISSLLKKDIKSKVFEERYIKLCVLIGKHMPNSFLYYFIYILNNLR